MNLLLIHFRETFDQSSSQKGLRFLLRDKDLNHYRVEVLESSPDYSRWYNVSLGFLTADKHNQNLWLIGINPVFGTRQILPESPFKIETVDARKEFFVPKETKAHKNFYEKD